MVADCRHDGCVNKLCAYACLLLHVLICHAVANAYKKPRV
jgi:hypothetical protein